MTQLRTVFPSLVILSAVAAMLATASCGVYGGGGSGPTVDARGNIADVLPADSGREIVVFLYTTKDEQVDCENPQLPDGGDQFQSRTLEPGETEFEVRNAKAGHMAVVFLLDEAGNDADGSIDPGDPIAILNDPDCVLDDVPNKYIVTIDDVEINFGLTTPAGFPAPGRAEADDINEDPE